MSFFWQSFTWNELPCRIAKSQTVKILKNWQKKKISLTHTVNKNQNAPGVYILQNTIVGGGMAVGVRTEGVGEKMKKKEKEKGKNDLKTA